MLKSGLLEAVQIGECIVVIITISLVIITLLLIELYIMEIYITFLSVDEILWSMSPFKINLLGSSFAWCYLFLVFNKMK